MKKKKKIGRQDVSPAVGGGGLALCAVSEANGKLFLLAFSVRSLLLRAEAACRGVPACRAVCTSHPRGRGGGADPARHLT